MRRLESCAKATVKLTRASAYVASLDHPLKNAPSRLLLDRGTHSRKVNGAFSGAPGALPARQVRSRRPRVIPGALGRVSALSSRVRGRGEEAGGDSFTGRHFSFRQSVSRKLIVWASGCGIRFTGAISFHLGVWGCNETSPGRFSLGSAPRRRWAKGLSLPPPAEAGGSRSRGLASRAGCHRPFRGSPAGGRAGTKNNRRPALGRRGSLSPSPLALAR